MESSIIMTTRICDLKIWYKYVFIILICKMNSIQSELHKMYVCLYKQVENAAEPVSVSQDDHHVILDLADRQDEVIKIDLFKSFVD